MQACCRHKGLQKEASRDSRGKTQSDLKMCDAEHIVDGEADQISLGAPKRQWELNFFWWLAERIFANGSYAYARRIGQLVSRIHNYR